MNIVRANPESNAANPQQQDEDGFRIPDHTDGPVQRLRKQLRASGRILGVAQILVGAVLPLAEGVLVNQATGAEGAGAATAWGVLAAVAAVHGFVLYLVISAETPLPHFLVEFDQQARDMAGLRALAEANGQLAETLDATNDAVRCSIAAITAMSERPPNEIQDLVGTIVGPWVEQRTEIFWFRDGGAMYNFAVYLQRDTGMLGMAYRLHDSRIRATNRDWKPGCGHVGMCFSREQPLFSANASETDTSDLLETDRPEDKTYYRALVSAPIFVDGVAKGVFIVTSSSANQFEKPVHTPVAEVVAGLLGLALRHCWEGDVWQNRRTEAVQG